MKTLATKVMIATCCTFAAVASAPAQVSAQTITGDKQQVLWDKLAVDIREIDRNLDGVMGVAIEDLTSGQKFFLHEDAAFPQASSIKIAVLAELYPQAQLSSGVTSGKAKLTDLYTVESKDLVQDSDLMLGLTPGVIRVTNRDLATMMVAVSDNSAANVLIEARNGKCECVDGHHRPNPPTPAAQDDGHQSRGQRPRKRFVSIGIHQLVPDDDIPT